MRLLRTSITAVVGVIAVGLLTFVGTNAAIAAQPTQHSAIVADSIVVTNHGDIGKPLMAGEWASVKADWAVPDSARGGDTFAMTLPPIFSPTSNAAFDVTSTDGAIMGTCLVSYVRGAPTLGCTLSHYIDNKTGVGGKLWVNVNARQSESSVVVFVVDGKVTKVPLPGGKRIALAQGAQTRQLPDRIMKYGWPVTDMDDPSLLGWAVLVPGAAVTGETLTFSDRIDLSGEHHKIVDSDDARIRLTRMPAAYEAFDAGRWQAVPPEELAVTVSDDALSFSATLLAPVDHGALYRLTYFTRIRADAIPNDEYKNTVVVRDEEYPGSVVIASSGGGTGTCAGPGRFALRTELAGPAADLVPVDTSFTVTYRYEDTTETLKVPANGRSVNSARVPAGTKMTIEKVDLPALDGVAWAPPRFTGDGIVVDDGTITVTPGDGQVIALTLVNQAEPSRRARSAQASVDQKKPKAALERYAPLAAGNESHDLEVSNWSASSESFTTTGERDSTLDFAPTPPALLPTSPGSPPTSSTTPTTGLAATGVNTNVLAVSGLALMLIVAGSLACHRLPSAMRWRRPSRQ
ncbi:Ig-like domain-containing protein [Luethyella okanaganae]|uniref:Ig-like domain-containing protein n=1 Tax=Luethyella okanaganae TaxID=69372 RepID=A0ABW1VKA1_9MICO